MYYRRVFTCEGRDTDLPHTMHQDGQSFGSHAKNNDTARQPALRETGGMCSEEGPATLANKPFDGPVTKFD